MLLDHLAYKLAMRLSSLASSAQQPLDFHFCRIFPEDTYSLSIARHEHYLCTRLDLRRGSTVLQIGSGTGEAALELARYADVNVVGVEPDLQKVHYATSRVEEAQMSHRISFVYAKIEDLGEIYPDATFDAVIAVESLKDIAEREAVYNDIFRLLKPGGKFGIVDWCWTPTFNPSNTDHLRLASLLTSSVPTTLISSSHTIEAGSSALEHAGLTVVHCEDLGARPDKIPWYMPLERALGDSGFTWSANEGSGKDGLHPLFGGLDKGGATVIVQAAKWKLFTPLAFLIAEKPAS